MPNPSPKPQPAKRRSRFAWWPKLGAERIARIVNLWVQSSALLGAGLWAFFSFMYPRIEESRAPASIQARSSIGVVARTPDLITLRASVSLKNTGHLTAQLHPSLFVAYGNRVAAAVGSDSTAIHSVDGELASGDDVVYSGSSRPESSGVLAIAQWFGDMTLGGGQEAEKSWLIEVRPSDCDEISLIGEVAQSRVTDRLQVRWEILVGGAIRHKLLYRSEKKGSLRVLDMSQDRDLAIADRLGFSSFECSCETSIRAQLEAGEPGVGLR